MASATLEGLCLPNVAAGINNRIPINFITEPHSREQANDRSLIFGFGLLDHAARNQLIENLPHGLWMIGFEDFDDRSPWRRCPRWCVGNCMIFLSSPWPRLRT
jgi:hypothetical protein